MAKQTIITQTQYAKTRNCSKQAINHLIKSGVLSECLTPDNKIIYEIAEREIIEKGSPKDLIRASNQRSAGPRNPNLKQIAQAAAMKIENAHEARAMRELYAALNEKVRYEKELDALISKEQVAIGAMTAGRTLRDMIMQLPPRLAGVLISCKEVREIELILQDELRGVLDAFTKLDPMKFIADAGKKDDNDDDYDNAPDDADE